MHKRNFSNHSCRVRLLNLAYNTNTVHRPLNMLINTPHTCIHPHLPASSPCFPQKCLVRSPSRHVDPAARGTQERVSEHAGSVSEIVVQEKVINSCFAASALFQSRLASIRLYSWPSGATANITLPFFRLLGPSAAFCT